MAFECGFSSVSYFTKCFHDHYGYPPGQAGKNKSEEHPIDGDRSQEGKPGKKIKRQSLIISGSSLFVIATVVILLLTIKPFARVDQPSEKSIAVLPFTSLSDDPEKQYLADGAMDAILLHLSKIEDLRVMARVSVEQYRETNKTASTICKELNVVYLLEGSFQKYGDQARLIVQLIEPSKGGHVWAKEYDRDWKKIFEVQSEVAQSIAAELKAIITPEEKQRIEKTPTTSLTAYDFYQRGEQERQKYSESQGNRDALKRAEDYYRKALSHDSAFAQAYVGLAKIFREKHYWGTYFKEDFLDSVLIYSDMALSFDNQLSEAYSIKGGCFYEKGLTEMALEACDKALEFNPNDWLAYRHKGHLNFQIHDDYIKAIENLLKAASLNHGPEFANLLRWTSFCFYAAGFLEEGDSFAHEALKSDGDTLLHSYLVALGDSFTGNMEGAIETLQMAYAMDSSYFYTLQGLGFNYFFLSDFEKSHKYFKKYVDRITILGRLTISDMHRIGYAYLKNGYENEAEFYLHEQKKYCEEIIKLNRSQVQNLHVYYDLAGVFAVRGEKDRAYENLRVFNQKSRMASWAVTHFKYDPLFESIRDEPEFQQILRDVEAKYQAEHERVRQWLEEQDML